MWPLGLARSWPLAAFHTRVVLSPLVVMTRWLSSENSAAATAFVLAFELVHQRSGRAFRIVRRGPPAQCHHD